MPLWNEPFCTIIEAASFIRAAEEIFSEQELSELFDRLATDPEAGVLIPGGGGIRKLRWQRGKQGKRGGARVIYFHRQKDLIVLLLGAFAKNRKSDMTEAEKAGFRKVVEEFCKDG